MWFDILLIVVGVAALLGLIFLLGRHGRQLAALDIEQLPQTQPARLKQSLLEQRLQRQLVKASQPAIIKTRQFGQKIYEKFHGWAEQLVQIEESYRRRLLGRPLADAMAHKQQLRSLLNEAEILLEEEKYSAAEKVYLQILTIEPTNLEAYSGLGNLYYRQKDYDMAAQTFEHLIKLHGGGEIGYSGLGLVAAERGDLRAALGAYEQSLRLNPQAVGTHFNLAKVYEAAEDLPKALSQIQAALAIEPANPRYLDYGIALAILQHDAMLAEELLGRLSQANPDNQKISEYHQAIQAIQSATAE